MTLIYDFGVEKFEYEIDDHCLREAILTYYANLYGVSTQNIRKFVLRLLGDDLLSYEDDEEFLEYLKEECRAAAQEEYEDMCAERRDPYGYRGLSESDFH